MESKPVPKRSWAQKLLLLFISIPLTLKYVDDISSGRNYHVEGPLAGFLLAGSFGLYFLLLLGLMRLNARLTKSSSSPRP